jgi:FKBP-type peptidyl-prolyl cis-trans isomerase
MSVFQISVPKVVQASVLIASFALLQACDKSQFAKVETDDQKVAYSIGYNFGQQLAANTDSLDLNVLIAGLKDGFNGSDEKLTAEERTQVMQAFSKRRQEEMKNQRSEIETKNKSAGQAFLTENKAKEGVVTLESGLQYKVLTEGTGAKPAATDTVKVHYVGTLIDGTEFDSSVARGEPAEFALNRVIPGWTEALQLMKAGGKWQLFIPAELAYGPRGSGAIEPHSTLIFDVELLEVVGAK